MACPGCGVMTSTDALFCGECGCKIPPPLATIERPAPAAAAAGSAHTASAVARSDDAGVSTAAHAAASGAVSAAPPTAAAAAAVKRPTEDAAVEAALAKVGVMSVGELKKLLAT